jgi:hypothetical protein
MLKRRTFLSIFWVALFASILIPQVALAKKPLEYIITVTNLTKGQYFTPVLGVNHDDDLRIFEVGQPASPELETLAETGDPGPLKASLDADPKVSQTVTSSGLLGPGQSVTITLSEKNKKKDRLSLVAMLTPTNDAFMALNGVIPPGTGISSSVTYYAVAYDAGGEENDELCVSIPGPQVLADDVEECTTLGGADAGNGEGLIFVHAGIHGVGDLKPENRDWRNPVAKIVIERGGNQKKGKKGKKEHDDDDDDDE